MGKHRNLQEIRAIKGTFHAKMGTIKDRNGTDLTETEDVKERRQEYIELYKKGKGVHQGCILSPVLNIFCFSLVHTVSVLYRAQLCMKCSFGMSDCLEEISAAAAAQSLKSCPTLCDPIDVSPPGSSVHGIFQARILEWGAIAFSGRDC